MKDSWQGFLSRRRFLKVAVGSTVTLTAAGLGTGLYANQVEPFSIDVVQRDLPVEHLPTSLMGQTLIQISDMHVGPTRPAHLAEALDQVANLDAAIVVITGDMTDGGSPEQHEELLALLQERRLGRLATVAILGNHDFHTPGSAEAMPEGLTQHGVQLLRNESCSVEGLQIIGLDDLWRGKFRPQDVLPQRNRRAATIVLSHNPDTVDHDGWAGYRGWILSGHTHGGQVCLPGMGPVFIPVKNKRYVAGQYDLADGRKLYINRGLGYSRQVRMAARPEITVFTLQRA